MLVKMVNGRMYERRTVHTVVKEEEVGGIRRNVFHGLKEEWIEIVPCWEKPRHLGPKVRNVQILRSSM